MARAFRANKQYQSKCSELGDAIANAMKLVGTEAKLSFPHADNAYEYSLLMEAEALHELSFAAYKLMKLVRAEVNKP